MKWSKYSVLKTAEKVSFTKEDDVYYLVQKLYDFETGEALTDSKSIITLAQLEFEKSKRDKAITDLTEESAELAKAIEDFKKL
tara:strand:- start:3514 stop:3762 length:249 start_codon:yes stop_codon:yes gene_type:complete